jgi:hypothetical protein
MPDHVTTSTQRTRSTKGDSLMDDFQYEPDPGECPNCGAPTGGGHCNTSNGSGLTCLDLADFDEIETRRAWDEYESKTAEILARHGRRMPGLAATLADGLREAKERANAN